MLCCCSNCRSNCSLHPLRPTAAPITTRGYQRLALAGIGNGNSGIEAKNRKPESADKPRDPVVIERVELPG